MDTYLKLFCEILVIIGSIGVVGGLWLLPKKFIKRGLGIASAGVLCIVLAFVIL